MISNRLQAIIKLIPLNTKVVDIGTDHAYLALELVKRKITKMVIATDKHPGPYEIATGNVIKENMQESITVRYGDGLTVIEKDEAETLVIAGMGGTTIIDVLQKGKKLLKSDIKWLVLQPMNAAGKLRKWLCENEFVIQEEELIEENEKIYEIILAGNAQWKNSFTQKQDLLEKELGYEVGQILFTQKHTLLRKKLIQDCARLGIVIDSMKNSYSCSTTERLKQMQKKMLAMEKIINE